MFIRNIISSALVAAFATTSCAPAYVANTSNAPMFDKAKELTANISYFSGINAQVAYSFSDHIAAMANGNVIIVKPDFSEAERPAARPHHLFGEAGLGYFKGQDKLRFEVFGGYGIGEGYSRQPRGFLSPEGESIIGKGTYDRFFLQPSVGMEFDHFMFIITTRISAVNFRSYSLVANGSQGQSFDAPTAGYNFYLEPALTWRFRPVNTINPFVQISMTGPLHDVNYHCNIFHMAVGIQLHSRPSQKHGD